MSTTKKEKHTGAVELVEQTEANEKTCFIIMPIADHPDYEKGHFKRVYDYLIKPACEAAGYKAVRADDSKASHMIMFDILKKIVECDMAICDLTTKNANVFYELGLRQAFNKKTILITDGKEKAPFDISGFRYVEYSSSLRIDEVNNDIVKMADMLIETESASDDINSIVKLLEIKPAKLEPKELNNEESMLFKMIMSLNKKIDTLSNNTNEMDDLKYNNMKLSPIAYNLSLDKIYNSEVKDFNRHKYSISGKMLGELIEINDNEIRFTNDEIINTIQNSTEARRAIMATPKLPIGVTKATRIGKR
ncbi:hypothetical protein M2263_003971 [Providencia alcalifaciens]|nr:hypothetical protein [Providencia alcalifaciens]